MWIFTENGDLVNLDQVKRIGIPWRPDFDRNPEIEVKAWEAHYDSFGVTLCTCENEEHGRDIIEQLTHEIDAGERLVYMSDVKKRAGVVTLYEQYAALCAALRERECESCGGPAQHVDPDGSTFCFECVQYGSNEPGAAMYPGIIDGEGEES